MIAETLLRTVFGARCSLRATSGLASPAATSAKDLPLPFGQLGEPSGRRGRRRPAAGDAVGQSRPEDHAAAVYRADGLGDLFLPGSP